MLRRRTWSGWKARLRDGPTLGAALLAILTLSALAAWFFLFREIDAVDLLRSYREVLASWRDQHFVTAAMLYVLAYIVAIVLSLPINFAMTVLGGFLFGFLFGTLLATAAGMAGAVLVFAVAQASFGERIRRRVLESGSSRLFERMDRGFRENALFYVLLLRLAPTLPSVVCNAAPAFFGVRTRTFAAATLAGIVPSTVATAWLGASLSLALEDSTIADQVPGYYPFLVGAAIVTLLILAALPRIFRRLRP